MSYHNRQVQEPYHTTENHGAGTSIISSSSSGVLDEDGAATSSTSSTRPAADCSSSSTTSSTGAGAAGGGGDASLLVPSSPAMSTSTSPFEFSSPLPPFQHGRSDDGDTAKIVHQHHQHQQQQDRTTTTNAADPGQHDGRNQHSICDKTDALPAAMQKTICAYERFSLPPSQHSPCSDTVLYGRPRSTTPYEYDEHQTATRSTTPYEYDEHQTATTSSGREDYHTPRIPFSPIIISRRIPIEEVDSTAVTSPTSFPAWDNNNYDESSILSNDGDDSYISVQPNMFSNHEDETSFSSPSATTCSTSNSAINDYEHVLKRRKIRRQEYQFDKHPGDDDDNHSVQTVFATVSTATPRSTQSLNISNIKTPLCDVDLDAFSLFPPSVFGGVSTCTNDEHGFRNLLALSDRQLATSFTTAVFDELEIVFFEESDRRSQRTHLSSGFAGLGCRHCKVTAGRTGGRYFPSTMKTLTDSNKTLFAIHRHIVKCKSCPDDVKTNLNHLLTEHAIEKNQFSAMKRRSGQRPFFDKVWGILRSNDTGNSILPF